MGVYNLLYPPLSLLGMYYGTHHCGNGHSFDWSELIQCNQSESEAGVGHCPRCYQLSIESVE